MKNAEAWLILQTTLPIVSGDGSTRVWSENAMAPSETDGKYWWDHANMTSAWWAVNGDSIVGVAGVAAQPA